MRPDTHFVWAFIAPVIRIFFINICFLIMAAIIMWNQQKKRIFKKESYKVLGWPKAVASLMVVMGFTWIIGLLIVRIEELAPLAYIYTIAVAFQGFFMFLVLVVFTKKVRDDIKNWFLVKSQKMMKCFKIKQDSTEIVSNLMKM